MSWSWGDVLPRNHATVFGAGEVKLVLCSGLWMERERGTFT
jgi:hypothetical protein